MTYRELIVEMTDKVSNIDKECHAFVLERDSKGVAKKEHSAPRIWFSIDGICLEMPPTLKSRDCD